MIESLPPEVIHAILSYCDYATGTALTMTCKTLSRYLRQSHYKMHDLLHIERWPCYDLAGMAEDHLKQPLWGRDYFACFYCLRIRSAAKFTNAMMKGKRGKRSRPIDPSGSERSSRFCIDCGIRYGRYIRGETFDFGGARVASYGEDIGGGRGLVCLTCGRFARIPNEQARTDRMCPSCHSLEQNAFRIWPDDLS